MAANTFLSLTQTLSPSSSSSSLSTPTLVFIHKDNAKRQQTIFCKAFTESSASFTKRNLSVSLITGFVFSSLSNGKGHFDANAAILEADDDQELLEKVKRDRKKRLEKQGAINSSVKEKGFGPFIILLILSTELHNLNIDLSCEYQRIVTLSLLCHLPSKLLVAGYLQDLVYKLSKVGQAIENNDLSAASSVLGGSTDTDWVQKANQAFTKLSSNPEEMTEVDIFNSSLASLISSVAKNDIESSKVAFVASASAFEKWTSLTGLVEQLKGL